MTRLMVAAALVVVVPARAVSAQSFPTSAPKPTRLAPARFPPFKEATLLNGLQLVVVERHEQPVVSVSLAFRAGGTFDPAGKEGLAELTAELLSKGTETKTADQIAATIEGVGGSLSGSAGPDFLTISVDALSDQAGLVFDLLGDVALHSTFPDGELQLARTRALSALALQLSQPSAVAQRFFSSEVYGRNPYGRNTTRESYQAVTRDDIIQFARVRLRPAGALLVVAGDVTEAQVRELATKVFASWRGAAPANPAQPTPPARSATTILLVHRPGSAQANIALGNTTITPTDPGYYPGRVATQVLGGGPDARLFLILREQKSWTYGAYAALHRYRGLGYWQATAEVRTDVADSALAELLRQVERIRTEPVPDSELVAAKGFLVGSFPLTIETASQIAGQVANAKLLGLGDDYLRLYRERFGAVTALQARAAAARLYRTRALSVVVVGDGAKLYDRLKAIAPVRVVDVDGKAVTPADLAPPATPVALDSSQFVSHADSSRVLIQGTASGFTVSEVHRSGDSLIFTERSNLAGGLFQQQTTLQLNSADGSALKLEQQTSQRGQTGQVHITYGGGRVKGSSTAPQPDGSLKRFDIDTTLPVGTMDENAIPFIVPALPLASGKTFNVTFFAPSENAVRVFTFKVTGPTSITVPAGTFPAYQIDVTGSPVPITMYVSTDSPRKVLKMEYVGQPFVVELVK